MAAGQGFKTFATGDVLTAADVNGYLMQGVLVFATTTARDAAITSPQQGQVAYIKADNLIYTYNGSTWSNTVGDITGVTAGKGLTGGGTTGDVTVSLATTAKGDLVAGTGASTAAALTVGADATVLTADSTTATGLKWASSAAGGMTSLATGTLSGTSITISSINQTYNQLMLFISNPYVTTGSSTLCARINGVSTSTYSGSILKSLTPATDTYSALSLFSFSALGLNLPTASGDQSYTLTIPNYSFAGYHNYLTTSAGNAGGYSGFGSHWAPTGAAVTSITLTTSSGLTFGGGTYTLYGVK